MKQFFAFIITLFLILTAFTSQEQTKLEVTITNLKSVKGQVVVALFNKKEGFPNEQSKALKILEGKISNGKCRVVFENIPFGIYAIGVYHDENDNKILDETWYGMPKEGVGVSNNPNLGVFSSPKFETAKFELKIEEEYIVIKITYL